ncbi:MAG: hypothetical protein GY847_41365 [Proteobacteria bacterium]|nr:hypothetical protein [Pseudomonadota bacterium]
MSTNIYKGLWLSVLAALLILGCDSGQEAIQPPAPVPPPVQQAPVLQPVAAPVVPPPTPLVPVAAAVDAKPAGDDLRHTKRKAKADGVDKALPGEKTEGDELIGNYSCKLDSKDLPLGPFKLPALGCRIFKADDGSLKLGPTSPGIASIRGKIESPTQGGFFVTGGYKFPGNKLGIKVRMQRKPGAKAVYAGKGRGMLNKDKSTKRVYTLNMTKK